MPVSTALTIVCGSERYQLTGRVALLVAEIIAQREWIERMNNGCVELHCSASGEVEAIVKAHLPRARERTAS